MVEHVFRYALVVLWALLALSWCGLASAHSAPPRRLKDLAHPATDSLEILPRKQHLQFAMPHKRSDLHHRSNVLRHDDSFRLVISVFNETFYLHLRPNDHLIHPAARINYYHTNEDGKTELVRTEPLLRDAVRVYWGEVIHGSHTEAQLRRDAAGVISPSTHISVLGWARIIVHDQGDSHSGIPPVFEGAFTARGVTYTVVTRENYLRHRHPQDADIDTISDVDQTLVVWRDSDVMTPMEQQALDGLPLQLPSTCGHDSLPHNVGMRPNPKDRLLESRDDVMGGGGPGDNFITHIGESAGCPKNQKVVYMGVAADCEYTSRYANPQNATTQILTVWNSASALYKSTFNVSLGIVELQIQNRTCPTRADPAVPWNVECSTIDLNQRLSRFSQWRGNKGSDGAGLWHLMSGCPSGTEVGIAWLSTVCQQGASAQGSSVVSGTAVSTAGRVEWQVVAHEIGHNFGAIHDCTDGCTPTTSCCPRSSASCSSASNFLMSPVADSGEQTFSPCSLGNICSLMQGRTNTTCFVDPDPNRRTISLRMCGNGIVEEGEDCDPGMRGSTTCCDPDTCKFRPRAVCDPASSPCCTSQCTFAPPTQVCRPSRDANCDQSETCTGNSSACPTDIFSPNGQSCGSGLSCASGQCTSLDLQCQIAGASMGLRRTCPSPNQSSCQVSCQDPQASNQCIVLQTILVDGSPCGLGGFCQSGTCKAGSTLEAAKALFTQNLQISIPVTVVVGLLVIGIIFALIKCCINSSRRATGRNTNDAALANARPVRIPSNDSNPPSRPPQMREQPRPSRSVPAALVPGERRSAPRRPRPSDGDGRYPSSRPRASSSRRQFPSTPSRSNPDPSDPRARWVDDSMYNGR